MLPGQQVEEVSVPFGEFREELGDLWDGQFRGVVEQLLLCGQLQIEEVVVLNVLHQFNVRLDEEQAMSLQSDDSLEPLFVHTQTRKHLLGHDYLPKEKWLVFRKNFQFLGFAGKPGNATVCVGGERRGVGKDGTSSEGLLVGRER